MAESQSPIICVTCERPLPPDTQAEHAPRYIGQYEILPRSDNGEGFANEVKTLMGYVRAVSYVTRYAEEMEEDDYEAILELIQALTEEAERRNELTRAAMEEVWKREEEAKKATHARKEGV
jgi:hypothetical protein